MKRNLFFILFFLIALAPSVSSAAVEVFLDPPFRKVNIGDTFIVNIRIKTEGECVNAIRSEIHFRTEDLKAIDWSSGQSLISLWTEAPKIDHEKGVITFSGGIPGGYCGRVIGDPGLTNILGKIIFSTPPSLSKETLPQFTNVNFTNAEVLLNDGRGTDAEATTKGAQISVVNERSGVVNEWLTEVKSDVIAPELFTVSVYRDPKISDGKFFIAWFTEDKQSGIDRYEVMETNPWKFGFLPSTDKETSWVPAESPYILKDQNLRSKILVKAIDKIGNERIVEFNPKTSIIPGVKDIWTELAGILLLCAIIGAIYYRRFISLKRIDRSVTAEIK
ncbi:MAG: hypothetical protein WCT49_03350 [Candidatus Paceibacterota bacterium]